MILTDRNGSIQATGEGEDFSGRFIILGPVGSTIIVTYRNLADICCTVFEASIRESVLMQLDIYTCMYTNIANHKIFVSP